MSAAHINAHTPGSAQPDPTGKRSMFHANPSNLGTPNHSMSHPETQSVVSSVPWREFAREGSSSVDKPSPSR